MNVKDAITWFREKYPDAIAIKDGSETHYYDCKESFRLGRDNWKMRSVGETIYFSPNELNPDLTMQVRLLIREKILEERRWMKRRLEEVAAELALADKGFPSERLAAAAYTLRRVREALQVPVVNPKKGKKR